MPHPPVLLTTAEQWLPPRPGLSVQLVPRPFRGDNRRSTHYVIRRPAVVSSAPPLVTEILVTFVVQQRTLFRARRVQRTLGSPVVILPLPSIIQTTLRVVCVAVRTRIEQARRALFVSGLKAPIRTATPVAVDDSLDTTLLAVAERIARLRKQPHWKLSTPTVLAQPPPVIIALRSSVAVSRSRSRRGVGYVLQGPVVSAPPLAVEQTISTTFAATRRPRTISRLPKAVIATAAATPLARPVSVSLAHQPRRRATSKLPQTIVAPTVSFVAQPPKITLARARRTRVQRILGAPVVVLSPVFLVANAVVTLARQRRPLAKSRLAPPQIIAAAALASPVDVTLAKSRRPGVRSTLAPPKVVTIPLARPISARTVTRVTRRFRSKLSQPTVVAAAAAPAIEQTVQVTLVSRDRLHRRVQRTLGGPVVVSSAAAAPFPPVTVTIAHQVRRKTVSVLRRPVVVGAVVTPLALPPRITLNRSRLITQWQRYVLHALFSPMVVNPPVPVETQIGISLARSRPRRTTTGLRPPTSLQTFEGAAVTIVHSRPRPTVKKLGAPVVLRVFRAAVAPLVRTRPRPTHPRLAPPAVVLPSPSLRVQTVRTTLAGRTRSELSRRASHWKLNPPTAVTPPPRLSVLVIRVTLVAVKAALATVRRQPKPRLAPPAKVKPSAIIRLAGPIESAWATGRLSADYETDIPDDNWKVGKPL